MVVDRLSASIALSSKSVPSLCSLILASTRFITIQNFVLQEEVRKDHTANKKGNSPSSPSDAFPLRFYCGLSGHRRIFFDDSRDRVFAGGAHHALHFFPFIEKNQRGDSFDTVPLRAGSIVINI